MYYTAPATNHDGFGLFANKAIEKGEVIYSHPNKTSLLSRKEVEEDARRNDHFLQVGKDLFSYVDFPEHCLNHSCSPNVVIVVGKTVATKEIAAGEELLADYRQFMGPEWSMYCGCCHRTIQGRAHYS